MIDLDKLRESEGYILAIVNTKTGEYEPVSEDVMPVIRCKDCKYSKCIEKNDDWWECYEDHRVMHGDGYCSWAERKEE